MADVILFNSHHNIAEAAKLKLKFGDKVFVHRIDGPMKVYNNPYDIRDNVVFAVNKKIADGTIFQSVWSQKANHELKLPVKRFETVVHNTADLGIFNVEGRIQFSNARKIRLIAASWSPNWNKGFEVYKWLDENLDFRKYQMAFRGNSPVEFKNIEHLPSINSRQIAEEFKQSDIFIFASAIEACSNLLIEALSCGLPVIAPNSSSNPEILKTGGELFNEPSEIPSLLEKIVKNYREYQTDIHNPSIEDIGKQYYDFLTRVYYLCKDGQFSRRAFGYIDYCKIRTTILFYKFYERVNAVFSNRA